MLKAKKVTHTINNPLGKTRTDDYHWIRDANWKEICKGKVEFADPDVKEYIDAENANTEAQMADTDELQKELYDELLSRLKEDDDSVPTKSGPYFYYSRTEKGKNYSFQCRKKAETREELPNVPEEIWMDLNKEAESYEQFSLGALAVSPDHKLAAYGFNTNGSISFTLRVRDLTTGKDLDWEIPNINGSIAWEGRQPRTAGGVLCAGEIPLGKSHKLYYVTRHPENGRGNEVHTLDVFEPEKTSLVFKKPEHLSRMFMNLYKTTDEHYIVIKLGDHSANECYLIQNGGEPHPDLENPILIQSTIDDVRYSVDSDAKMGRLYIKTNAGGATNFKIMVVPMWQDGRLQNLSETSWKEFIPHQDNVCIDDFEIYKVPGGASYMIRQLTNNDKALSSIAVKMLTWSGAEDDFIIDMPEEAYSLSFAGASEFTTQTVRYYYQSPTQPYQTIEFDLDTKEKTILKTKEVPNFNPDLYQTERHFVKAHDGETIPLTLMYKKDIALDGSAPAYVYGYGSYGSGMTPYFSANRISLLDRGFVFAVAHVRGGDEKGYGWYLNGKLNKKKNTFLDFISCCEFLADEKYTSSGNIVAGGGSAGGMLMGAIANMRPELFKAIVADVAFVDVMNTMEDTSLPLTESEWNEWGNPLEDEEAYEYMLSYSPYDNVVAQDYPHMLFNSGISDEQVTYWEPTKMVAKLRELKTNDNLLLLKMKMTAGHGGASKRYESYKELAFEYAFCLKAIAD